MLEYISSRIVWKHYRQIDLAFCVQQVFFFLAKKIETIAFFFTQLTANFVRLVFKNGLDIQVIGLDKVSFISLIIALRTLAVYLAFLFHLIQF